MPAAITDKSPEIRPILKLLAKGYTCTDMSELPESLGGALLSKDGKRLTKGAIARRLLVVSAIWGTYTHAQLPIQALKRGIVTLEEL